jgi:hypothetical protein
MAIRDPQTEWRRVQGYRAMTPQRRFEIAQGLMRSGRSTVERAIQEQRPGLSPQEIEFELWNRIYGRRWLAQVRGLKRPGRQAMEDWQIVAQIIQVLEAHNIPYAIVGGYSAIYWGRPRFTQDADLVVDLSLAQVSQLVDAWSAQFVVDRETVEQAVARHSEFALIHKTEVYKTDVWVSANTPYDREVFRRRRRGAFGNMQAFYQSPEDTILSKLRWCQMANFSERQFGDALGVYEVQEALLDQKYLDRWAQTLGVADLLARVRDQAARPPE